MKTLVFTVKGTEGSKILLKPFNQNSMEYTHIFTGGEDVVTVDISAYVGGGISFNEKQPVLLCAAPGEEGATGEFKLISVEFSASAAPEDPNLNKITNADNAVTKWYAEDAYTLSVNDGVTSVTIGENNGWAQLKADVSGADLANMKTFRITLSGINGDDISVKPYDKV